MNRTQLQNLTEATAQYVWAALEGIFACSGKTLPPIYYFLSPKSKGSLKGRSLFEIDLVHRQQVYGEGITLKSPPAAYVSTVGQALEEAAHLFAISYQPSTSKMIASRRSALTKQTELWAMILHEAFGSFSHCLLTPQTRPQLNIRPRALPKALDDAKIWEMAHLHGYYWGQKLAEEFRAERVSLSQLKRWFQSSWYSQKQKPSALEWLETL